MSKVLRWLVDSVTKLVVAVVLGAACLLGFQKYQAFRRASQPQLRPDSELAWHPKPEGYVPERVHHTRPSDGSGGGSRAYRPAAYRPVELEPAQGESATRAELVKDRAAMEKEILDKEARLEAEREARVRFWQIMGICLAVGLILFFFVVSIP